MWCRALDLPAELYNTDLPRKIRPVVAEVPISRFGTEIHAMQPHKSHNIVKQIACVFVLCIAVLAAITWVTARNAEGTGGRNNSSGLPCQRFGVNFSGGEFG